MDIFTFKRIEKKYRITQAKKDELLDIIGGYLIPDEYGKSTICSLYLDTPDYLLIRNSIDAKVYKEKLRIRSYGTPSLDSKVFLEIKKKYKGVVYKRRVSMPLKKAYEYLDTRIKPKDSQIMREIDYAMDFYHNPKPKMLIAYEREAFYVKDLPALRLTFDHCPRYRTDDLLLEKGSRGKTIISDDEYILEIKTDGGMPLWLSHALDECEIRPSKFSKYGTAYQQQLKLNENSSQGEKEYATV